MEWKVAMRGGRIPAGSTSSSTRRRISPAALFVNVTARTWRGWTPSTPRRKAMRWAMTRVLPLPAPARTRSGPRVAITASRCTGFSGPRIASRLTSERSMGLYDTTRERAHRGEPGCGLRGRRLLDGDGLGEVPRLVHVAAEPHRHVVGQQLERDGHEDGRQEIARDGKGDHPVGLGRG